MTEQADDRRRRTEPRTIADVLEGVEPMGDLRRFVVDDLTPDEEDEFFRILEGARRGGGPADGADAALQSPRDG